MATPEGRVKAMVSRRLKELLKLWKFMPVQSGYGTQALDYICCVDSMFVMIETKKPGGAMTPTQLNTKADVVAAGGIVLLVWDDDSLNTAMEILSGIRTTDNPLGGRVSFLTTEAQRRYEEHLRAVEQGKTPAASTRRDHGAPRKASKRRSKPSARGHDQTAPRQLGTPYDRDGYTDGSDGW